MSIHDRFPQSGDERRLVEIMDVIVALASNDFTKRATVGDGSKMLDGVAAGLNMLAEEIGLRHEREQALRLRMLKAERLSTVGQLVSGVAHEINTPAACVLANDVFLKERLAELEVMTSANDVTSVKTALVEMREIVEDNLAGIERIVRIVKRLRTFARFEEDSIAHVMLDDVVEEACKLVSHQLRDRARLNKTFGGTPAIFGDYGKLTQVVTHLLLNAIQSIPEGAPSHNEVSVSTATLGDRVVVRVRDSGSGIPKELQARLFEPFFTTKPRDQGTGLGLAIAALIVRRHGGEITFESQPGAGSVFEVWLPLETKLQRARSVDPSTH